MIEKWEAVFSFEGKIWRIHTDPLHPGMIIEIRYKEKKQVEFYSLNIASNNLISIDLPSEEPWLWGVETVRNNVLLIHSYKNESSPEHRYLIAYRVSDAQKIWENYTHVFNRLIGNTIEAYPTHIEPRKFQFFDLESGAIVDFQESTVEVIYPNTFPERLEIVNIEDFINYNNHTIRSYQKENSLVLDIENTKSGLMKSYILATDIQVMPEDTFFIYADHLFFIQNKSELHIYNLSEQN